MKVRGENGSALVARSTAAEDCMFVASPGEVLAGVDSAMGFHPPRGKESLDGC